jgi:hypothetical protein
VKIQLISIGRTNVRILVRYRQISTPFSLVPAVVLKIELPQLHFRPVEYRTQSKHAIEENIKGARRRGRRSQQLLDDLKERRRYCN